MRRVLVLRILAKTGERGWSAVILRPVGRSGSVGIDGVDRVIQRRHENYIVCSAADIQVRNVERLSNDPIIYGNGEELAESGGDVRRGEGHFGEVLSGAGIVVVVSHNADLTERGQGN